MQASAKLPSLFPDEIVFEILHFLHPCEVIRLRLVSKQFNAVTRDARLWRSFYTNARLLRPSGPFLRQSAQFLERVLIHSARVSHTWTSRPIRIVSCLRGPRIPIQPSPVSTSFDFLFGRLFIWCEGEQLLAQDLESGVGRLLWESSEPISSLSACSLALPDAERVFIALRHIDVPVNERTPIKLLEFPLQDDARLMLGPLAFEMDLPGYANFPLSAKAPFLYFDGGVERQFGHFCERVVVDARTWVVYRFPAFSSGIEAPMSWETIPPWPEFTLLSERHIVVFLRLGSNLQMTLIQAFIAPDSFKTHLADAADVGQRLRLTHEALLEHSHKYIWCLRSAVVDPATGDANLRFLVSKTYHAQTHLLSVDLTIPAPSSRKDSASRSEQGDERGAAELRVLPMSVHTQQLLVLSGTLRTLLFDASNDGHGRGIVTMCPLEFSADLEPDAFPIVLYKFSVDASGERCTAMVSEPYELNPRDMFWHAQDHIFDGVRGRICLGQEVNRGNSSSCSDLVVLDLH